VLSSLRLAAGPSYAQWPHWARAALVVLVPGMATLRASYRFLVPVLKEAGYRVVCTDLRGHSDSDATFSSARRVSSMICVRGSRQSRRRVYRVLHGLVLPVWRGMGI
jgi:pimeloyl-ACP methyl ester carboxylesterase